jgi:dihydrofolate reductase
MKISLIAALGPGRVIGKNGALPWRLPADLKRFRALTRGHAVIMGRKSWDSLGRPLPDRLNIVITRNEGFAAPGARRATSLEDALALATGPDSPNREQCFVIGGAEIYRLALPIADTLELTWVEYTGDGDAWFPEWDAGSFREIAQEAFAAQDGQAAHRFVTYSRVP